MATDVQRVKVMKHQKILDNLTLKKKIGVGVGALKKNRSENTYLRHLSPEVFVIWDFLDLG